MIMLQKTIFAVFVVFLGYIAYSLYPEYPNGLEFTWKSKVMSVIIKTFNKLAELRWYTGFYDPFFIHKIVTLALERNDKVFVKIHMPDRRTHSGVLIYFHGGGYVMGSTSSYRHFTDELARDLGCPVISVDYRLAPQYPHPYGLDDCVNVIKYIFNEGYENLKVDPTKIVIAGDGAGGHYAAAATVEVSKTVKLKGLGLIVPVLQHLSFNTPSHIQNRNMFDLPRSIFFLYTVSRLNLKLTEEEFNALMVNNHTDFTIREQYANKFGLPLLSHRGPQRMDGGGDASTIKLFKHLYEDPSHSPLFADLSHFPPTVVLSAEYDVLRDDSVMFVQRMRAENRSVEEIRMNSVHSAFKYTEGHLPAEKALDAWKKSLRNIFN